MRSAMPEALPVDARGHGGFPLPRSGRFVVYRLRLVRESLSGDTSGRSAASGVELCGDNVDKKSASILYSRSSALSPVWPTVRRVRKL